MAYLKNREICLKYNVSYPTVIKWMEDAELKKNNLQVERFNNKLRAIDNLHNQAELYRLASSGKKFRSNVKLKKTEVNKNFYKLFSDEEIIDIFNDLDLKRELKLKYTYRDGGANLWDDFYNTGASPVKTFVNQLLDLSYPDLLYFSQNSKKINIVDIGPGNGYPVKDLISKLQNDKLLYKYIGVDISEQILEITKSNMSKWFTTLEINGYVADIDISSFSRIFLENSSVANQISNIIIHVGNTMSNHDDRLQILKNFRNGMSKNDLLLLTFTLDTLENRSTLNYVKNSTSDLQQTWVLSELGFDIDKCQLEVYFDDVVGAKVKTITLDKDYIIYCNLFGENREIEFFSGEEIVIWKHYLTSEERIISELKNADLKLLCFKLDTTLNNAIVICKVRR